MSVEGGLGALQFFWSLTKGTRTFNFRYIEPSRDILGPLSRYDHPWKKKDKQKKNKLTRIRDLFSGKKCEIPHFCR